MPVAFFVLRQVFAELVLFNQIARNKQLEGIIYRCPADIMLLLIQVVVKGIGFKMVGAGVYFVENGKPLVGFT